MSELNIRALMPIMPTIARPDTVMRQVSLIDDMPLIDFPGAEGSVDAGVSEMSVPGAVGLKVFLIWMGMLLWNTG